MIKAIAVWLLAVFSSEAVQLEGAFTVNPMAQKTGVPYVFMLTSPFVSDELTTRNPPITFLLAVVDLLDERMLCRHVVIDAHKIGVDRSCYLPIPIMQINEIVSVDHPEDWDEECADFISYASKIAEAGVDLLRWETWLSGQSVVDGRNGYIVETLPDGQEIIR